jgi:hypothetical protein
VFFLWIKKKSLRFIVRPASYLCVPGRYYEWNTRGVGGWWWTKQLQTTFYFFIGGWFCEAAGEGG